VIRSKTLFRLRVIIGSSCSGSEQKKMDVELTTDLEKIRQMYHRITEGYEKKEKGITFSNLTSICFLYWFTHPIEYIKEMNKRLSCS